jgi:hypothetical protein
VRLLPFRDKLYENQIPVFVLPIEVEVMFGEKEAFDKMLKEKLMQFEA